MTERLLKKPKTEDVDRMTAGVTRGFRKYGHSLQSDELAMGMLASASMATACSLTSWPWACLHPLVVAIVGHSMTQA